jgi:hypothetical protein
MTCRIGCIDYERDADFEELPIHPKEKQVRDSKEGRTEVKQSVEETGQGVHADRVVGVRPLSDYPWLEQRCEATWRKQVCGNWDIND